MKANLKIFILFIVLGSCLWIAPQKASAQVAVSFQVFYDDLSPYGNWVDYPNYGYVWVPNAGPDFTPYGSNGHWVFTDYGWTWVSNYSWGWAPFHYGRWHYDPYYGNIWVPGNEWGPGWVSWRQSEGYYGWAPIEPGISIDVAYSSGYNVPNDRWIFVGSRDFGRSNMNSYYVDRSNNTTIINNTTVINNVQSDRTTSARYNAGPDRSQVQSRTGNAVALVALKESNKPGQNLSNGELQTYRPRVEKGNAKPSKVADIKDVNPSGGRKSEAQPNKENQPVKAHPAQPKSNEQPVKQQPAQHQQKSQPAQEQPGQPKHNKQPASQQPAQPPRKDQPAPQQPAPQQQPSHQGKPQQPQQQPSHQPAQPKPSKPKHNDQPAKSQPQQEQPKQQQPESKPQPPEHQQQQPEPPQNNGKPPKTN